MEHEVWTRREKHRFLACCTCGWRGSRWHSRREYATEECDEHEQKAKNLQLNSGPKPSLKTLAKDYRKKSESDVYTADERLQWLTLAVGIEEELKARQNAIDGQTELF